MKRSRVTMRDVAVEAGVAPMTVSYTYTRPERVAAATRATVLEAAERLGYRGPDPVARSLRNGSTGNLGVVLGEHLSYAFEDPQASRFLAGVSQVCVENRLGLVLIPATGAPDDSDRVREAAVDGFVVWTTVDGDPVLDAVAATGRPAAIQGGPGRDGIVTVSPNDRDAARAIASHALADASSPLVVSLPFDRNRAGGLLRGPETSADYPVTRSRLEGFRDAIEETGRRWADIPVAVVPRNDRREGERVVRDALEQVRPDVVITMSDQLAAGVRDAVGEAIPVTGWDDSDLAESMGFASIRQSLYDQGVACAQIAAGLRTTVEPPVWSLTRR
ncbi:LacI family DNA-binding transcriptional regulator [Labedella endophytica]|uniref:LacI family DNA-binding transcriptional regulator n=1 Tax=Labedella endophytica TaxID=1523160 RepID=A0A433JSC2_9MICO|nr:LacI family DNA-binding transcriptional regulator [Labedella endophytica]RUR01203.1 LacI family DNA-binding transcriptional regulator [Labedella endophytica]